MPADTAPARREQRDIPLPGLPGAADRIGQGTAIEQSRAAAEVYASVLAAKNSPRDEQEALRKLREVCKRIALAEKAFYRYSRGGQQITGGSIQLAREIARCWGNIHHGVFELRRDDAHGQSEMQAYAWDLESNVRPASIFIVPHRRDKRGGSEPITDARDVYELNANAGARRVREAIFAVVPGWFVDEASERCRQTLREGDGKPLQQRVAEVLDWYARLRVSEQQLIEKLGRRTKDWTEYDLAPLGVIYRSIRNGEATVEDEFPTQRVTADEIRQGAAPAAGDTAPPKRGRGRQEKAAPEPEPDPRDEEPDDGDRSDEQAAMERELAEQDGDQ